MPLKVELKPGERIILGECVITNADDRTHLLIDGNVPILRQKDILTSDKADTPAKRIYLAVQLMYTARDPSVHHDVYFSLVRDVLKAAPSTWPYVEAVNNRILTGNFYKALKEAKRLIEYERELFAHAERSEGLRRRGKANLEPA